MEFSIPWTSLFGGVLLGSSASILMLMSGKVVGISGIASGLLSAPSKQNLWRLMFVVGMLLSAYLVSPFGFSTPNLAGSNIGVLAFAGLLVGFGTRLANGCTSGHGIVGMGRLSKRSIFATLVFMGTAMLTVFVKQSWGVL